MAEPKLELRHALKVNLGAAFARRGPSIVELRVQAQRALSEKEGVDLGPLSHAERNKILFGN